MTGARPARLAVLLAGSVATAALVAVRTPVATPDGSPAFGMRSARALGGAAPVPMAPWPNPGSRPETPGGAADPDGVGSVPRPGEAWRRLAEAGGAGRQSPIGGAGPDGSGSSPEGGNRPVSTEREIGVPSFPYDPEARAGESRRCVRDCTAARSACADSGAPARRCEGGFALCVLACARAPDPPAFRSPGD